MDDVTVCNMTMGHIGADNINDLKSDRSTSAEACNTFFETARDATLEAFDWGFARVPRPLAKSALENTRTDWAYMYEYPSDIVSVRRLLHQNRRTNDPYPFEVALKPDGSNRCVLTDLDKAKAICTFRVVNLNLWTPLAIEALSWKLAALTVTPITQSPQNIGSYEQQFQIRIAAAQTANANQGQKDKPNESELVESRW